jgi:hypothetical protein
LDCGLKTSCSRGDGSGLLRNALGCVDDHNQEIAEIEESDKSLSF